MLFLIHLHIAEGRTTGVVYSRNGTTADQTAADATLAGELRFRKYLRVVGVKAAI